MSLNYDNLKKYQKLRVNCDFCINKVNKGVWCSIKNFKCSYDNCPNLTHTYISHGNNNLDGGVTQLGGNDELGVSKRQVEVFKLKETGLSFKTIADKLGMSKKNAWKLYQKAIRVYKYKGGNDKGTRVTNQKRGGNDIRLHNDVVIFRIAEMSFNFKDDNLRHLKYASYVNLNFDDEYVKIFREKLIVGFRRDIVCKSVKKCKVLAEKRMKSFLSYFSYPGLLLTGKTKQVSRHYAILGTELAKKFVKEKEKIIVYDRADGKRRISIDFSNEKPEFESEHLVHGDTSAEKWHSIIDDIEHNPSYLPSFQKNALDVIIGTQEKYAKNIELHLEVMKDIKDSLKEIKEIAKK